MRSLSALAVSIAILAIAGVAVANPDEERSRELFTQAAASYDAGDRAKALELYRESYELVPRAKTLLNIGVVLSELGRSAEAANTLASYARDPDADRSKLEQVRSLLADLDRKLLRVLLIVDGDGEIEIDGKRFDDAPFRGELRLTPGAHIAVLDNNASVSFEGNAGDTVTVELKPKEKGFDPVLPTTPAAPPPRKQDDRSFVSHPALWTGVVAVAAAGVGTGYAFAFRSAQSDLDDINNNSGMHSFEEALAARDKADERALIANIAFGAAGVAAATTVVLLLVIDRDSSSDETAAIAPVATPDGVGVSFSGRF